MIWIIGTAAVVGVHHVVKYLLPVLRWTKSPCEGVCLSGCLACNGAQA